MLRNLWLAIDIACESGSINCDIPLCLTPMLAQCAYKLSVLMKGSWWGIFPLRVIAHISLDPLYNVLNEIIA